MPYSSRRKQSKPQHLLNDGVKGEDVAANQPVTSSHDTTTREAATQEVHYGSMVTGNKITENGTHEGEDLSNLHINQQSDSENGFDTSDSESHDAEFIERNLKKQQYQGENDVDSLPHDLSLKSKLEEKEFENDIDFEDEGPEGDGTLPMFTSPSEFLSDRFCVYCNVVKKSPADLERHLRKHTGDRPFQCQDCSKSFKSKRSLQYHQYMNHGTEPADSNIAQRYQLLRKRRLEDQHKLDHDRSNPSGTFEPITSSSPTYQAGSPSYSSTSPSHIDSMASKRQKMEELTPPQSQHSNAVTPNSSDSTFELRITNSIEDGLKSLSNDSADGQDLTRACPVCTKVFPKPSDLKRHMMCHTGEKPFRCRYCNKPFRAKSSMHYHLKATHGIEIELSPGLEERYLRMKTRAQINFIQRGHLTGVTFPFGSEGSELPQYHRDNIDIDEIEEDTKSTDSSYFHNSGIGSDFSDAKSQGHFSNTGIDRKMAMDLSISDRSGGGGEPVIAAEAPFQKNKISIQNETVLITRLDGLDLVNGECSSIYKCYLCGKMFSTLSKMQCHLSLHFEKQIVSYECCFCDELFKFKTQMKNHIRRKHTGSQGREQFYAKNQTEEAKDSPSSRSISHRTMQKLGQSSNSDHFKCRYCRKAFVKKISLHKHMRLHFWNKNCFCRICGKSFNQYTSLQLHISRFHWKSAGKDSWLRQKYNFFNTNRFKQDSHDGMTKKDNCLPLNLIKRKTYQNDGQASQPHSDVTVVMPQSPLTDNGDISDAGTSHHSSDNNWSESLSDNTVQENENGGIEIKTAPRRSLLPFRRESSPRSKSSRKSTPTHLKTQNQPTSDNNVPLNFIKTESLHQDSNNNESSRDSSGHLSPNSQLNMINPESIIPGYSMNATSHLLMAKALAAHQAHQTLTQHLNHTSQSLIFPHNQLPPSIAAMTGMMTLPVTVQVPTSDTHTGTSKSPSPASYTSSKSDTSPDDKDGRDSARDSLLGYPRVQWGQNRTGAPEWTFNMYCPTESNHTDGRKVTSLSRTHSRLGIVHSPINRESMCKPTQLPDGRTVYKCPFCSKEFVSFSDINRHMDFHEDIRPYKCQCCDYFARTNSQLKVHMMRHQGIREFCCKLCNYKGVTQSDLNRHMKSQIHMLKSRNACKYCGEGFVTAKNLEKHLDGNCIVKMQKLNGGLDMPLHEGLA